MDDEITDQDRKEAKVLSTLPRDEQKLVVTLILKQAKNRQMTAEDRHEALRRGNALRRLLRLKL